MSKPSNLPASTDKPTISQSFLAKVEKQYTAELGNTVAWGNHEATLAQHLFLKIDAAMIALQKEGKNINWGNVNMTKLSLDAPHVVALGLDGLIKNHINVVPYWNEKTKQYDLSVGPGYEGALYSRQANAVDPVVSVRTWLIYEGDHFVPLFGAQGDSYEYRPINPLNPGGADRVIGGFGFIRYEDSRKNKLVLVTMQDFARSESAAPSKKFWSGQDRKAMLEKTVVWRTVEEIQLDPRKVNSFAYVEKIMALDQVGAEMDAEIEQKANKDIITMQPPAAADPEPPVQTAVETGEVAADEEEQETETPPAEPPAQATAAPEPQATKETPPAPKPAETANKGLVLTDEQKAEVKDRIAKIGAEAMTKAGFAGASYALFIAKVKQMGISTYDEIDAALLELEVGGE